MWWGRIYWKKERSSDILEMVSVKMEIRERVRLGGSSNKKKIFGGKSYITATISLSPEGHFILLPININPPSHFYAVLIFILPQKCENKMCLRFPSDECSAASTANHKAANSNETTRPFARSRILTDNGHFRSLTLLPLFLFFFL